MDDEYPVPGRERGDDGASPMAINEPPVEPAAQDRYAMPPEPEAAGDSAADPVPDRYVIPEPDEIASTYVRHEAPWVGFGPSIAGPPPTPEETEFTRILRRRQRWRASVAWVVTAAFIIVAAWFLPVLLAPTSSLGRVGSFATLAIGGIVALAVLWRTWRWANGRN